MSRSENAMSRVVLNDDLFVVVLNSVLGYVLNFVSEYNLSISQATVIDVDDDMMSSEFLPPKSRQSYPRYHSVDTIVLTLNY